LINPPRRTDALNKPFWRSKELPSLGRRIKHSMNKDPFDDFWNFHLPEIGRVNLSLQKATKRERKKVNPNKSERETGIKTGNLKHKPKSSD
jgi:hypothetical protein